MENIEVINDEKQRQKEFNKNQIEYLNSLEPKQKDLFLQVVNLFRTMDDFFISLKKQDKIDFAIKCDRLALEGFLFSKHMKEYTYEQASQKMIEYNKRCCKFTEDYYIEMDKLKIEIVGTENLDYKPETITMNKIMEMIPTKKENKNNKEIEEYIFIN